MAGEPTSKNEAALRIIMGELAPLIQNSERIVEMFNQVHEEMNADLTKLGELVARNEKTTLEAKAVFDNVASKGDIQSMAKYIESKIGQTAPKNAQEATKAIKVSFWVPCLWSALIAASSASAVVYFTTHDLTANAKIGKQLQDAWPKLDKATQEKLNAAFAK